MNEELGYFKKSIEGLGQFELTKILSELQSQLECIGYNMNIKTENTFKIEKEDINKKHIVQQKIFIVRDKIIELMYSKIQAISENVNSNDTKISWGINITQPQLVFEGLTKDSFWIKRGTDAVSNEKRKITVSHCGKMRWCNDDGLEIEEIVTRTRSQSFSVNSHKSMSGKKYIHSSDIAKGIEQEYSKIGELDLLRIQIYDDNPIEYFMLVSMPPEDIVKKEEFKEFFTTFCTSKPHIAMLTKKFKEDESIYGGKYKIENNEIQSFIEPKAAKAVTLADQTVGTCQLPNGMKKFGTLQDVLGMVLSLQKKEAFLSYEKPSENLDLGR